MTWRLYDYFAISGLILIMVALFGNLTKGNKNRLPVKGLLSSILIFIGLLSIIIGFAIEWLGPYESYALRKAFLFGFAIAIFQIVADRFLDGLSYKKVGEPYNFSKTPFWMTALWTIVMTVLCWWYFRSFIPEPWKSIVFLGSFLYLFVPFELLVGNSTYWWERRGRRSIFGVAICAFTAEAYTVIIALWTCRILDKVSWLSTSAFISYILASFIIALGFVGFDWLIPKKRN